MSDLSIGIAIGFCLTPCAIAFLLVLIDRILTWVLENDEKEERRHNLDVGR